VGVGGAMRRVTGDGATKTSAEIAFGIWGSGELCIDRPLTGDSLGGMST